MSQRSHIRVRNRGGIDQVFGQRPDNAVAPGVDGTDLVTIGPGGFDHARCGSIDDRGDAARLGVKSVLFFAHISNS